VHTNINRNKIQGHAVEYLAGMKHSAESWGTGRAVARIPRVSGSGTHRSGQAAFGNMCRKGRMFAPIRIWRKWHRRVNIRQKRYAVGSAIAASAVLPLVQARGHAVDRIPELPFVITDSSISKVEKTKQALKFFKSIRVISDIQKVYKTIKVRAGRAKSRNRRFKTRRGPLFVYSGESPRFLKAIRGITGVDICNVNRLNLLQLAPGGHFGRFIIWTESAFRALSSIFSSAGKHDYQLPRAVISNPDVTRLIKNSSVQENIAPPKKSVRLHSKQRGNPLVNKARMDLLNPYDDIRRKQVQDQEKVRREARLKAIAEGRSLLTADEKKARKANKSASKKQYKMVQDGLKGAFKETMDAYNSTRKLEAV
jgi:large subunit ribosomal protein L4e